jgi:hypothetical protein
MSLFLCAAITFYGYVMVRLYQRWSQALKRDVELSPSERRWGWVLVTLTPAFWFFVLPFAYLELQSVLTEAREKSRGRAKSVELF